MALGMRVFLTIILTLSLFCWLLAKITLNVQVAEAIYWMVFFKEVTQDDLAEIGNIEGMNIGICIRYQLLGLTEEEFDLETIAIVDDCCCE